MTAAELRRRAAYLHRQSRETTDPALARALAVRALRLTAQANRLDGSDRPLARKVVVDL